MSEVSKKDVQHIADLARLSFTEEEQEQFTTELNAILEFAQKINELDTSTIPPTSHPLDLKNVFRADTVRESVRAEQALQNTAEHENDQIKVPSVIEE